MPGSSPGSIHSLASVEIATTLWPRALSALVENAATTISGERYKAGKEKPPIGGSVYAVQVAMPEAFHVTLNGVPSPAV